MVSAELEILDQLLGGDMPLSILVPFFESEEHFCRAILMMLEEGEVEVFEPGHGDVPQWRWRELSASSRWRIRITARGAKRVS